MNDVPNRSINRITLKAPYFVFGDHERVRHSHKVSAKYTHSINLDYQASFLRGYLMSSYEELIQPRQEESVSWVIEHRSVRICYGRDATIQEPVTF